MDDNLSQTLSARCFLPHDYAHVSQRSRLPNPSTSTNGAKKRGRPRMASRNDSPRKDRREQIRYAQRTYRHKKDLMYRNMENRLAKLEGTMTRLSDSLSDFHDMAVASDLHITHPHLFESVKATLAQAKTLTGGKGKGGFHVDDPTGLPTVAHPENTLPLGYVVDREYDNDNYGVEMTSLTTPVPDRKSQVEIERPLPGATTHTYSFQETDPTRIFQRLCLEHTYRIFSDPRSDPQEFYRVFRLVPCVKWAEKFGKYLLCLVRSGSKEKLDIPALPFYCIGGAGTHYTELRDGEPVYPEKMRLPRRVLGNIVGVAAEDVVSVDRQKLLALAGLDGTWLDCRDVIGFLHEKGVLWASESTKVQHEGSGEVGDRQESSVVDIQAFFQALLKNMVILGRSPGFRLCDVEAALAANLRVNSK
ncbi:bZIP transcription factor [Aspergillus undulatus]|uniref:bZIP transcription factor n=1 Tax=Aspergillus undulatus TaxID=1810928 RepID=UPI003CCE445E